MHLIDHWAEDNIYSQNNLLTFKAWHSWQIFFKNQMNRINVLIQGLAILVMEAVAKKKKKAQNPLAFILLLWVRLVVENLPLSSILRGNLL